MHSSAIARITRVNNRGFPVSVDGYTSLLARLSPPSYCMKEKPIAFKPIEKEILRLHQAGKSPDLIAIRTGMKMSKVLSILNMTATGR